MSDLIYRSGGRGASVMGRDDVYAPRPPPRPPALARPPPRPWDLLCMEIGGVEGEGGGEEEEEFLCGGGRGVGQWGRSWDPLCGWMGRGGGGEGGRTVGSVVYGAQSMGRQWAHWGEGLSQVRKGTMGGISECRSTWKRWFLWNIKCLRPGCNRKHFGIVLPCVPYRYVSYGSLPSTWPSLSYTAPSRHQNLVL